MCMEDGGEEDPPEVAAVGVAAAGVEAGLQGHHQDQAQVQVILSKSLLCCDIIKNSR